MKPLKTLLKLLDRKEKRNLLFLCFFMFVNALFQVLGIAIIAPLIAAITMPGSVNSSKYISYIENIFDFNSHYEFSITAATIIMAIMFFGNIFILTTNYLSLRFANNREYSIGCRLLTTYLRQPYSFFLNRHSAELLRNVHNEVAYIASNIVSRILSLMTFSITALCIIAFIFFIDPIITLLLVSVLGGAYFLIYLFVKKPLYNLGKQGVDLTEQKLRIVTDSVHMIKEIKMQGLENMFLNRFSNVAQDYARVRTLSDTAGISPKYLIEIFAVAALVIAIIYMVSRGENQNEILPVLGMYAFAGFRLMPALQNVFLALSRIQFSLHSLNLIAGEIATYEALTSEDRETQPTPISFSKTLCLEGVSFSYDTKTLILDGISISIPIKSKIALAGKSGAGKSTIIDLIAGLTYPSSGKLLVDGATLNKDQMASWRANVAYTSQNIYLLDDDIDMNITLQPIEQRDLIQLNVAKKAALIDFDDGRTVGENGLRLSGGQKQRIGIARALYQHKPILILDEATSAIDNTTEFQILKHLEELNTTLIFITHKVETMKFCDEIYIISNGGVAEHGSFHDLQTKSKLFNELLKTTDTTPVNS